MTMTQEAVASTMAPVVEYPERDGKPMGETDVHRREIMNAIAALGDYFRDDPRVYVAGDLLCYYEEGNPKAVVVPDVFVVRGVEKKLRRTYKLWEEGEPPVVVIEVSSRSSRIDDLGTKRALYAMLGVAEYYVFDPLGEYLKPQLQAFALHEGELQRVACFAESGIASRALGLRLEVEEGDRLVFTDCATGTRLLTPAEALEAVRRESAARQAAEEGQRAAQEGQRAAQETARQEAAAREQSEQQLAEAQAELERLKAKLAGQ